MQSLKSFLAVFLSLALICPSPGFAQESKEDKERAKSEKNATELLEKNSNYKNKLSTSEKKKAVDIVVFLDAQQDKELTSASVKVFEEKISLEALQAKHPLSKNCMPLSSREQCTTTEIPPTYIWTPALLPVPDFGDLFDDNEWAYLDGSQEDTDFKKALQGVVDMLKTYPGAKVTKVTIYSSASTLRNTEAADGKTHLWLSQKRAEEAEKRVKAFFSGKLNYEKIKKGDAMVEPYVLDYQGENRDSEGKGNGTSGPSSPFKCPKGKDKKLCPDGDGKAPSKEEMIAYVASLQAEANKVKIGEAPKDGEEPMTPIDQKPKSTGGIKGAPVCEAPPTELSYAQLVDIYYYQFKYIRVHVEATYPVIDKENPGSVTKDCASRLTQVCVSTYEGGGGPGKKKPKPRKHRGKRFIRCIGCFFYNLGAGIKDAVTPGQDCADFHCNASCGKIFRGR
jgi:hypothetical protein